jgi:hypothetical protein
MIVLRCNITIAQIEENEKILSRSTQAGVPTMDRHDREKIAGSALAGSRPQAPSEVAALPLAAARPA